MQTKRNDRAAAAILSAQFLREIRSAAGVGPDEYVFFLDGGLPLDAEHMTWLAKGPPFTPSSDPDDHEAEDACSFARVADMIPIVGRPWSASTNRVSAMFREWAGAAKVLDAALSPEEQQRLQEAADLICAGVAVYREHERAWRAANAAWQEALHPRGAGKAPLKELMERKRAVDDALQAWKARGGKARFETALATQQQLASRGLQQAMASLTERYDQVLSANRTRGGEHFAPVGLNPRDLFSEAAGWAPVSLRPGDPSAPQEDISAHCGGGLELPLLWIRKDQGPHVPVGALDPAQLGIAFESLYARIDRSAWFDSFLLMSRSWWWEQDEVLFSDGAPPPNTQGEWQMIPTGLVLVRNLIVDLGGANGTASEFARLVQSVPEAGCWIFRSHTSVATPLSAEHELTLLRESELATPQVQIVAVVCQLMPREPDPDPALRSRPAQHIRSADGSV